jgi:hypothetical protein
MSSNINPIIDISYPIAGVDNNSQGFRDNFTSIHTSLVTAKAEITELHNKVVLRAQLGTATTNTAVSNNLAGSTLHDGLHSQFNSTVYTGLLEANAANINIVSLDNGPVQSFIVKWNTVIGFTKWTSGCSRIMLMLSGDELGVYTVMYSAAASSTIHMADNMPNLITMGGTPISAVTVNTPGHTFTQRADVVLSLPTLPNGIRAIAEADYTVVSATVASGGTNYAPNDHICDNVNQSTVFKVLTITGGSSTGPIGTIELVSSGVYVLPDTGLIHNTTALISAGLTSGSGAQLILNFGIHGINFLNLSNGYTTAPTISITGAGATAATATVTLADASIGKHQVFEAWSIDLGVNVYIRHAGTF